RRPVPGLRADRPRPGLGGRGLLHSGRRPHPPPLGDGGHAQPVGTVASMSTRPAAILWDWDTTLVVGGAAFGGGLNAACRAVGMPEWDRTPVLANVRQSLRESFPALFGAEWERARDIFYAEVRARLLDVVAPMPGAAAALAAA